MRILVACERSGRVRTALRGRGHDAISCDIEPPDDGSTHHYTGDVLDILDNRWDMLIGFPECTYLCNSGSKHLYIGMKKENGINWERWGKMEAAAKFFRRLYDANIPQIALENPIMHGHAKDIIGVHQSQIIQPWQFGHKEMKATCLWLQNVPCLVSTDRVGPPPKDTEERKLWAKVHRAAPGPDRKRLRGLTYQGVADAMAVQWG